MPFKPFDLSGKVALVTGGNSGIGLGMAEGLAQAGASVVIWGTKQEKNERARAKLQAYGGSVLAAQVDVGDEAAIGRSIAEIVAAFGRLDFVAANAGVTSAGAPLRDISTKEWRRVTQINLDSVFWTLRESCKHMMARAAAGDPGGSLLVTSSTAAIHGAAMNQAYGATKAAVNGLMRSVAVEHARYGIRCNSVLPGWVRSDLTQPLQDWDKFNEQAIGRVPLRRWGEPEEFAGIAVYLASDASRFHTGDSIVIDGGYTVF